MRAALQHWIARIDALSLRERLLLFGAVIAGLVFAIYASAIEPAQKRQMGLSAQMERHNAELAALQELVRNTGARERPRAQAESAQRERALELKARIAEVEETIEMLRKKLVPAHRMRPLLQQMLKAQGDIQLVSLRSLPAVALSMGSASAGSIPGAAPREEAGTGEPRVYRHGVEVGLRGSYAALYEYMQRLERAPGSMFWWRAKLEADEHARLTLTLTLYTLSLDRAWLQV
jgi:MSHA biogenesis protein MshJ